LAAWREISPDRPTATSKAGSLRSKPGGKAKGKTSRRQRDPEADDGGLVKEVFMEDALTIFIAGLGGVFVGMAMLYVAILITPVITGRFERKKDGS